MAIRRAGNHYRMSLDATPILTAAVTGATGVLAGWIGYLAARHQGDVELKKVELEKTRLERRLEEPHFQHRQGVYHDFLDVAFRWHQERVGVDPSRIRTSTTPGRGTTNTD